MGQQRRPLRNTNIVHARDGILALMRGYPRHQEDIVDLLSAAAIHPEELGEPGPRMGLDVKQPNPYYSTKLVAKEALKQLLAEGILVRDENSMCTEGPNFQQAKSELLEAAVMKAIHVVHPFEGARQAHAVGEVATFADIQERTHLQRPILERVVDRLTHDGLLEDRTGSNGDSQEHVFCVTAQGDEFLQRHSPATDAKRGKW